jgi:NADP-dependent 3-hydroxy acid dehydrogenase YdfG
VANKNDVQAVVDRIIERHGRIDIGVFSAGINVTDRNWPVVTTDAGDARSGWRSDHQYFVDGGQRCQRSHRSRLHIGQARHDPNLLVEERNNGIRATVICPGEVATLIVDARPVPVSDEDKARILQSEDFGDLILFVDQQPPHVTLNEILITPTDNRFLAG